MHMRIRAARLAVLASLALAGGCALLATEPDPDDRRSVGRLVLDLRETHGLYEVGKGAPEIRFLIETERIYSHLGAQIHGEVRISGREITFRADHVTECSGICLTAIGPAQHRTLLPLEHGDYTLSVTADGRTDRYRVRVTAEAIEMEPLAATFTTARYPLAWRYPPRSMVHVCNASQGREALCDGVPRRACVRACRWSRWPFSPRRTGAVPGFRGVTWPRLARHLLPLRERGGLCGGGGGAAGVRRGTPVRDARPDELAERIAPLLVAVEPSSEPYLHCPPGAGGATPLRTFRAGSLHGWGPFRQVSPVHPP
jgi:hypothetical protein